MKNFARKHGYRLRSIWTMLRGFDNSVQTIAIFTGRSGSAGRTIRIRETGLEFRIRGAMDAWCLKETVLDRCYERYGFRVQPGWTVLDVGGGIGDFSVLAATAATNGRVYAFEPFPESFGLLEENITRNRATNAEPLDVAVTGKPRRLILDVSSGEPLMIEGVDATDDSGGEAGVVPSMTLAEIVRTRSLDRIDLLKLDCEGAEYEILFDSPPAVLDRVQRIVMEYHDHTTQHTHVEMVAFLEHAGFRVETFPSPVHPNLIGYLRASR